MIHWYPCLKRKVGMLRWHCQMSLYGRVQVFAFWIRGTKTGPASRFCIWMAVGRSPTLNSARSTPKLCSSCQTPSSPSWTYPGWAFPKFGQMYLFRTDECISCQHWTWPNHSLDPRLLSVLFCAWGNLTYRQAGSDPKTCQPGDLLILSLILRPSLYIMCKQDRRWKMLLINCKYSDWESVHVWAGHYYGIEQ